MYRRFDCFGTNDENYFGLIFSKPMFPLLFRLPDRKVLDPNGPYISTSQTKIKNVCLSIGNFGIL